MEFILTIDTEGDNQWEHGRSITVENLRYIPRFQRLCNKYRIKPTYFVTSEVCEDPFSEELFSDYIENNVAEVGAHLHAWTTPPFLKKDGFRYNDVNHVFATELPADLLANKVKYLTDQIGTVFGKRPLAFRSGRFGFNEGVAKVLMANQYIVDSSVTPYISWTSLKGLPEGRGGPDFINKRPSPYNYESEGKKLVEIPVTVMPTAFPLNNDNFISSFYFRNVDRYNALKALRKMFFRNQPLWLRPFPEANLRIFGKILDEGRRRNLPYLVMMFHSSELMPGCSIYRTDKESIEKLYELLEHFFRMLNCRSINSIGLSEAAKNLIS